MIVNSMAALRDMLADLTATTRMLLIAGLPGVGKSLVLQQAALLAEQCGRPTYLLRWDMARLAFEASTEARAFPPKDGMTHAAIRLAAGLWVRKAVGRWHAHAPGLLIGECPLVGNRFSELAKRVNDQLEPVLASKSVHFLVPVPGVEVRARIEAARMSELESPAHESEANSAPLTVIRELTDEIHALAKRLGVATLSGTGDYQPEVYLGVYSRLLRHRHHSPLRVETALQVVRSAQFLPNSCVDLVPSAAEASDALRIIAKLEPEQVQAQASAWWQIDGERPHFWHNSASLQP
ncbi:MAG: hypothetical protein OXF72_05845 [Gammaproteobacteria bacterium]|nr:hypothetical protein [Gammaproteobacteria bacterium]MCY4323074.1 hypothetical protein [Gammaproteobacteria bacterium]